uniref:ABEC1 enzyme n=1 Tax=Junco hyemalis TaxID=40217 RepID=A0A8C5JA21_JUNHY
MYPRKGYLQKRALRKQFDPREYPKETYLLCELEWRGGIRSWKHWVRNDDVNDCHAEQYFLEEIFEPRCYNICDMTWYLSYSPCWDCCDVIRDFLEEHTNVNIDILVARLYYVNYQKNCLRSLMMNGVAIRIMNLEGNPDTLSKCGLKRYKGNLPFRPCFKEPANKLPVPARQPW